MQLQQRPASLVLLPLLLLASSTSIITTASAQHVFSCQAHRPEGVDEWLPSCCLNYTLAADLPYPSPPDIPKDWGPRLILTLDAAVLHRDDLRGSRRGERLQLQRVPGRSAVWGGAAGVNLSLLLC
ncbi:hypothetical protein MGN70_008872 [Eutypa lata]|nr:hypothetical protein MGN70_008872 [Eutypa lata]